MAAGESFVSTLFCSVKSLYAVPHAYCSQYYTISLPPYLPVDSSIQS